VRDGKVHYFIYDLTQPRSSSGSASGAI